jgi:16S rRNA (cytosine1402-N4)-methyltransferase
VFQALRIAVNSELDALKEGLESAFKDLDKGGRLVVISFQSLEDRIVKRYFLECEKLDIGKILTKQPIIPEINEININKRSHSAKLRSIEKK